MDKETRFAKPPIERVLLEGRHAMSRFIVQFLHVYRYSEPVSAARRYRGLRKGNAIQPDNNRSHVARSCSPRKTEQPLWTARTTSLRRPSRISSIYLLIDRVGLLACDSFLEKERVSLWRGSTVRVVMTIERGLERTLDNPGVTCQCRYGG